MVKAGHIAIGLGLAGIAGVFFIYTEQGKEIAGGVGQGLEGLQIPMPFEVPSFTQIRESVVSAIPTIPSFADIGSQLGESIGGLIPEFDVSKITESFKEGFTAKLPETKGWTERVAEAIGGGLANLTVGWVQPYAKGVFEHGQRTGAWMIEQGIHPFQVVGGITGIFKPKYRGLGTQAIGRRVTGGVSRTENLGTIITETVAEKVGTIEHIVTPTGRGMSTLPRDIMTGMSIAKTEAQTTWESLTPEPFRRFMFGG